MKAKVCENYDELEHSEPGAILPARNASGAITTIIHRCPGCGEIGGLAVQRPLGGGPSWRMSGALTELTLSPSIVHAGTVHGGCGYHGFLVSGEWKPAT